MRSHSPPIAKEIPFHLTHHGVTRIDEFFGRGERKTPAVLKHLKAENEYTEQVLAPVKDLRESLFSEIRSRIKQDESTVPYKKGDYYYYSRYEHGQEYPLYCRKKDNLDTEEELLLDVNVLAKDHSFYALTSVTPSENQRYIAFVVDTSGRRIHTLFVKDLQTDQILEWNVKNVTANFDWASDNETLFYTRQDAETLRSHQVYRQKLNQQDSTLVFEEKDTTFNVYVWKSKTDRYLMLGSYARVTHEIRILPSDNPEGQFKLFEPREKGHEYTVLDGGDRFFIITNDDARNFKIAQCPHEQTARENWKTVIEHDRDVFIEELEVFKDFIAVQDKKDGLNRIRTFDRTSMKETLLEIDEPVYSLFIGTNSEFDTHHLRYSYQSLTTPYSVYDVNVTTRKKVLRKSQPVLGDFDPSDYQSERLFITVRDGERVPVSIVYKKGFKKNGTAPLLQYGYGSYGSNIDPYFSIARLSLLNRGFAFAIAHVRGGSDLGRHWYENGKLLNKKNTFNDFIDVSHALIDMKYTSSEHLYADGASAGGLLMGVVLNEAPHLYNGVTAGVPFVDVLTTMLDETLPLTTNEYDEWGDPRDKEYFDAISEYSPYDNVREQDYPHLLVTTGFHDSQVQFWEPAKWVARLRKLKKDDRILIFNVDLEAGHTGSSGRFERLKLIALEYSFYLLLEGITQ